MGKVKMFMVLDVEALPNHLPYNIGYIIADRKGHIYKERSIVIPANIPPNIITIDDNSAVRRAAGRMTAKNIIEILKDMDNPRNERKYQQFTNFEFRTLFLKDIKTYEIEKIYAFNCIFDKGRICDCFGDDKVKLLSLVKFYDIQSMFVRAKCFTKKYLDFCYDNDFVTEKGYPQTKAQTVFRYLTNDLRFEEEHTGLADTLIEFQILLDVFKQKKKLDYTNLCAWKQLNKFANEINHPIAIRG